MTSKPLERSDFDIIIVGGGIVGQTLALLLVRNKGQEFRIALVDSQAAGKIPAIKTRSLDVNSFSARVSALTASSKNLLEQLGLWPELEQYACPFSDMFVWDAEGTGNIHFESAEIQQETLGHIIENRWLANALGQTLETSDQISIIRGDALCRLQKSVHQDDYDESCNHQLKLTSGRELQCKLLVGADGANSFVREQSNFTVKAWDYGHQAIVATLKTEKPHQFTASQCFLPTGPLAFLPLLNPQNSSADAQHYSSLVWSCQPRLASELMALDDKQFAARLAASFEYRLGKIEAVSQRFEFPLRQAHASSYVQPGLALLGDAAHNIHPLAGQGLNLGMLDAKVLGDVVIQASANGENYGSEQVLSRYQRQRKGHNLGMMLLMEAFKRCFESEDLAMRWLRNSGLAMLDKTMPVKRHLIRKAMGF